MQKFILFDYNLLLDDDGEELLDSVIIKLVNSFTCEDQQDEEFNQLQRSDNFQTMIIRLLNIINEETIQFNNVMLTAPTIKFFTQILEEEFSKRGLQIPFVFQNTLDIQKLFKKIEDKPLSSLTSMAEHYKQYQLWSNISKMKLIILRLHSKNIANRGIVSNNQEEQALPRQLQPILRQDQNGERLQLMNRFPKRQSINRVSAEWESQRQNDDEKGRVQKVCSPRLGHPSSADYYHFIKNGCSLDKGFLGKSQDLPIISASIQPVGYLLRNGIRIRGLPFELTQRELVEIFLAYRPIVWSVKLGRRSGARTGQAVLLLQSEEIAEKALQMNGFKIYGRYLEVMLISMRSYSLFT